METSPIVSFPLGKKPARTDERTFRLENYVTKTALAKAPTRHKLSGKFKGDWGVMGNDVHGDCTCFKGDARIRMANGTTKPIKDIKVLDEVVSAEGRPQTVLSVMARLHLGQMVNVRLWGHKTFTATTEHPVLTRRGYVPVSDLTVNDFVCLPIFQPQPKQSVIRPGDYVKTERRIRTTGFRRYGGGGSVTDVLTVLPETIQMGKDFGRIVGLFLAEGSTCQTVTRWTFGGHEKETLVKELVGLLDSILGIKARAPQRGNGTIDVTVCGKHWRMFFESLCSKGVAGKTLHEDLWQSGSIEFFQGVLSGWLAGDGHHNKGRDKTTGSTVSCALAHDMFNVAMILGEKPRLYYSFRGESKSGKRKRDAWFVEIGPSSERGGVEAGVSVVWRKVKSLVSEEFAGYVFNLSVEEDQSYIAEGIGVHNCAALGHLIQVWTSWSRPAPVTVPDAGILDLYGRVNGGVDGGAAMLDVLNEMRRTGINGDKIEAFVAVERTDRTRLQFSQWAFGGVYLGFNMPLTAQVPGPNRTWDYKPNTNGNEAGSWGGHAISMVDTLGNQGYTVISWGQVYRVTWKFHDAYCDESFAIISPDWLNAKGRTPQRFDLAALRVDLSNL